MNRENANINLQILIVKRSIDSLDYNQLLNGDRYQIQECESVSEALEISQQAQTDCILVDWDSSELTRESFFQQLDKNLIPVVVVAENQNLTLPNYLVKATLTKEFLSFAIGQAIAQTALKRKLAAAQKELHDYQQSEINFQAFLNNAPAIIYTKDLDGRYLSINKEFEEVLQVVPNQICGKTDLDFLSLEVATALRTNDQEAILKRSAIHLEETVELEDGLHSYIATKFPLVNQHGEPYALAGISFDISDRKAAENSLKELNQELEARVDQRTIALKASESRYHTLMNEASDAIFQCNVQGKLVQCNRKAEELLGYTRKELFELEMPQIHPPEVLPEAIAHFSAVKAGRDTSVSSSLVLKKDGSHIPVEITANLIEVNGESIIQAIFRDISDRKKSEDALVKEIYRRRILFDTSIDGIVILNQSGNIIEANSSFAKMLGYDLSEMTNLNLANFDPDWTQKEVERKIANSEPYSATFETRHRRKDRSIYPVEISATAVDWDGKSVKFCICRDISDRRRSEQENQALRERLEFVISSSPAITYAFKVDSQNSTTTFISENIKSILGYTSKEFLGDPNFWNNHVHPADVSPVFAEISNLFKDGTNTVEYRFLHQDGTYKWLQDQAQVIRDQAGIPVEFVGSLTDISDRKQAELELQKSQKLIQQIADSSPNILYLYDLQGHCNVYANREIATTLGYTPQEAEAMGSRLFQNLIHSDDLPNVASHFEKLSTTEDGVILEIEYRTIHRDGTIKWLRSYNTPFSRNDNGTVKLIIGNAQDVSDRKKVEAFLELQNRFFRCLAIGDPLPSTLDLLLRLIELEIDHAICEILVINNQGRLSPITDLDLPNSFGLVFAGMTIDEAETTFGTNSLNLIDIATHPQWQNYQNSFHSQGFNTCWAIPINIRNGQQVLGFLNFYFPAHQIIVPTEFENTIIKFAIYVIGIAIERHQAEIDLQMQLQKEQILNLRVQQELSDRQIVEEKLRHSQELLTLTFENTPVGICTFDLDTQFLSVNQSICQMLGYSVEEILREDMVQLTHPDYREISMDGIQQLITGTKKSIRLEKQYIHQSGREIDAISRVRLIKDMNGKPLHFVASIEDITKQKQMKIALDQRMERQSFLMMISQQIRQSLNLDQVLETAVNEVRRLLDSDQVAIIQLCPEGATKIVKEQVDPLFASILNFNYLDLNFFAKWFESFINSKTLILNDGSEGITFDEQTEIPSFQSKIVAPIVQHIKTTEKSSKWQKNGNQLWGLLIVHSYGEFRQWQPEEAELIQHIANQLAIAIQQANLYAQVQNELLARQKFEQELQKQAAGDRLLSEITVAISQSVDIAHTLDIFLEQVREFMGADRAVVYKLEPSYHHEFKGTVIQEAVRRSELSILGLEIDNSCFATTDIADQYRRGKITVLTDILTSDLDPCYINLLQQVQVRANLVVPILHSCQLWGLLILHQCDRPRYWQPWEITFLQQIATQIGTVGQKEKLYLQLSSELSQKKVLLKEIHHRVKNNLQIMSSILYLQFRNTPPEIKLLSEEYQSRILSMSLIHDQLYRSDDLAHIDFHSYIQTLTTNLFQCYGTSQELIELDIAVKNIFLPLDQSIPLGLIINELVSNALKYAFPKMHGKIKIQLVQSDANTTLTIADNGVGIPADFDLTTANGLGMQLIQSLTEQLDGELSFDGKNGLMVQITFPQI